MFSKVFTSTVLALALALQASAHAGVSPALGVSGTLIRADVQRPSSSSPCGSTNIAATIDSSTAIAANAAGSFSATATNFNAGADGSRSFSAKVDATGKGTNFVAAKVTTNGDAAPTNVGSQTLAVSLPAGTKCTGGKDGNTCLVQFVSTSGFGNCVAVTQGAAAATAAKPAAAGAADVAAGGAAAAAGAAAAKPAAAATPAKQPKKKGAKKGKKAKKAKKAAGTRAARALKDALAQREADIANGIEVVKRSVSGWLFA